MSARNRRLPRGLAWPLTTTDITEHLGPLMSEVRDLDFLTGPAGGTIVLSASWTAPLPRTYGRSIHPDSVGFSLYVHPVPTPQRATTRPLLRTQALPQLHTWITQSLTATETWRLTPHQRYWHLTDGRLTHVDETTG
ncbi:hypothetical protein IF655_17505 [Streptomyces sp. DSM 110735]|uniref:hypothetical protein n=1 Tax=Streptomyces sp. DSM 110735 TaxID=2775031 RepID=UPI0018F41071|nr:hypothetical protein [Streptomyces sp. DSM 110735]MBJ7905089.1 hypothetical protein [Streptomyces sp. DSM 110735]